MPAPLTQAGVFTQQAMQAVNYLLASQGILTQGNVWWVRPYNGPGAGAGGDGKSPTTAFKTLTEAQAAATANQNDVVILCAENNTASKTTDYQNAVLTWAKDGVHLIGLNGGSLLSSRSRVSNSSTATVFANLFTISANGCLIANVEFYQGAGPTTLSAASTCVTVSGQRNVFLNCAICGVGDTTRDYAGSNSLTISGTENTFQNCYIGLDTVIRSTGTYEVLLTGTPARTRFIGCQFETYTSLTSYRLVSIGTSVDRFVLFQDCLFHAVQNITSSAIPAGVLGITTMNGSVLVRNAFIYGCGNITSANNIYVAELGFNGDNSGHKIGLAAVNGVS